MNNIKLLDELWFKSQNIVHFLPWSKLQFICVTLHIGRIQQRWYYHGQTACVHA